MMMRKTLQELRYRVDATMLTTILTQQFLTRPHNSYKFWWGKLSNIAYTHHPERGTYPRIAVTATPHHASLYFVCVIVVIFDRMDSMA
jgi:hypothetical protein